MIAPNPDPARRRDGSARIVNFIGARDAYHVPAVLHAAGRLKALITDVYSDQLPTVLKSGPLSKWGSHRSDRLDGAVVIGSRRATAMQVIQRLTARLGKDFVFHVDGMLDQKTLEVWRRDPSDLLLYSGYAEKTFVAVEGSGFQRGLFLFHPHHQLVEEILSADAQMYPQLRASFERDNELMATWRHLRGDRELDRADHVLCASAFSARSVAAYRADLPTAVVPYFSETQPNPSPETTRQSEIVRFLFVGQGVQRKGLHHLLIAWRKAGLVGAKLTCVCSRMDPAIAAMVPDDVEIVSGLSRQALTDLYDRASVFVMPSLVEGFGLVYLEAAKRGAAIIATENTGAPDMDLPTESRVLVPPGDVDHLTEALVSTFDKARRKEVDHLAIVESSVRYDFSAYANRLLDALQDISTSA